MNEKTFALEVLDEDRLDNVTGGIAPALIGAGWLAMRASPYIARGAQWAWRGISGGEGIRGATHRVGAVVEALSGDPSRGVMRPGRPNLQPNPPAITRMINER